MMKKAAPWGVSELDRLYGPYRWGWTSVPGTENGALIAQIGPLLARLQPLLATSWDGACLEKVRAFAHRAIGGGTVAETYSQFVRAYLDFDARAEVNAEIAHLFAMGTAKVVGQVLKACARWRVRPFMDVLEAHPPGSDREGLRFQQESLVRPVASLFEAPEVTPCEMACLLAASFESLEIQTSFAVPHLGGCFSGHSNPAKALRGLVLVCQAGISHEVVDPGLCRLAHPGELSEDGALIVAVRPTTVPDRRVS